MEGKHHMFWTQGDFGYVKQEVDSMMALCVPKQKVRFRKFVVNGCRECCWYEGRSSIVVEA